MKRCAHGTEAGCYCDGCAKEKPRKLFPRCGHGEPIGSYCGPCQAMRDAAAADRPAVSSEEMRVAPRPNTRWPAFLFGRGAR